jgi:hypothetical protein
MIVRFGIGPRRQGLDATDFQKHLREVHGPLVVQNLKNVRRFWQNHAELRDGEPLLPWPGFDTCSEMDFADMASLEAAMSDESYHRAIDADSEYLLDKSKFGTLLTKRILGSQQLDTSGVRLFTFMRRAQQRTMAELAHALRATPQASNAHARELFLALDGLRAPVSAFDAVDVQWFRDTTSAERYTTSAEAREHRQRVSHVVRGVERLIARPLIFI